MKYLMTFVLGLIISLWITFMYVLWCIWYLKIGWATFIVRRYKHYVIYNGDGWSDYKEDPEIIKKLSKETYDVTINRWFKLDLYSNGK